MKKILILIIFFLAFHHLVFSQSINFEFGISAVENFMPGMKNFGLSISHPFKHNFFLELSYNNWEGQDGNLSYHLKYEDHGNNETFFGNYGINMIGFFKVYETNRFSTSLGPGLGVYQMFKFDDYNIKYSSYTVALSFSVIPKYKISKTFSAFTRILISFTPTYIVPNWGILNLGIEISPFNN